MESSSLDIDELFENAIERLRTLAHATLSTFPRVRRWEDTDDVLNAASVRLCKRLKQGDILSEQQFLQVAAANIRWTLVDLARKFSGPQSFASNHDSLDGYVPLSKVAADETNDVDSIESWTRMHESVEKLPEPLRRLADLIWYHGLSVPEAARKLNLSESAVRKRWRAAREDIYDLCSGKAPAERLLVVSASCPTKI